MLIFRSTLGVGLNLPKPALSMIPQRPEKAKTGSEFISELKCSSFAQREEKIVDELLSGNLPSFLRNLRSVRLFQSNPGKPQRKAWIWVMPDYLSVGSDRDYVRFPVNFLSALKVAKAWKLSLPTPKIVDSIYRDSDCKLTPRPMKAGLRMTGTDYFYQHNFLIQRELDPSRNKNLLVAGHKKDVVLSKKLERTNGRIAIYGWHTSQKKKIQPCSTIHHEEYADYSHGIRLVYPYIYLENRWISFEKVLSDHSLSYLLSDEGPLNLNSIVPGQSVDKK